MPPGATSLVQPVDVVYDWMTWMIELLLNSLVPDFCLHVYIYIYISLSFYSNMVSLKLVVNKQQ